MAVPKKGEGWGLVGCSKQKQVQGRGRKMAFFKDALWGGGGVPTGAGLVNGGVDQGPWLQERVGGGVGGASPGKGSGKGWLGGQGGCKGFGCGGVGGRDTGPQGRSKFRNVCRIFVVSNA